MKMFKKALFLGCLLASCAKKETATWYVTNGSETSEKSYCIDIDLTNVNGDPGRAINELYKEKRPTLELKSYPDSTKYYLAIFEDDGKKQGVTFSSSLARCNANLKESLDFIHSFEQPTN
jgi:hypothetical protein